MTSVNVPICVYFQRGHCAFGNQCRYAHSRFVPYNQQYRYFSNVNNSYNNYNYYNNNNYYGSRSYYSSDANNYDNYNPNQSSVYSALFPTKREEQMDFYIDYKKETLIFDIDGTIADIENRLSLSTGSKSDGTRTNKEWNIVLNGANYKYDRVIPVAWAYLKYIESQNKYNILYLSGRRSKTIRDSMHWLFNINKYPKGFIIHRIKGMSGQEFKQKQLIKLNNKLNIVGYFGDRIIDDCICAIKAGVRPILVVPNQWLFSKHIYGGIESVINDVVDTHSHIPSSFINIAKNCQWWNMSYDDVVPIEFATELFDDKNKDLLPPSVLLKCQENRNYWQHIMEESNQILLLNNGDNGDNQENENKENENKENENKENDDDAAIVNDDDDDDVAKFIENDDSDNEDDEVLEFIETSDYEITDDYSDNTEKFDSKIESMRQQTHTEPQHRWLPVGQHLQH